MTNANTRLDGLLSFAGDDGGGLMPPRRPVGRHASPVGATPPRPQQRRLQWQRLAVRCCNLLGQKFEAEGRRVLSRHHVARQLAGRGSAHDTAHKAERGRRATLPSSVFGALAAVSVAAQIVAAAAAPAAAAAAVPVAAAAAPCSLIGLGELRTAIFAKLELRPRHALEYLADGGIHLHDAVRVIISAKLAEWLRKEAPLRAQGAASEHGMPLRAQPRLGEAPGEVEAAAELAEELAAEQ